MKVDIAIVNYGLGNVFSIRQACEYAGMNCTITADRKILREAGGIILPGVGAFGHAMANLRELDLVDTLKQVSAEGKPLIGICLGMQLLMSKSYEFGEHEGLGILQGAVVRLDRTAEGAAAIAMGGLKIPEVGWNAILVPEEKPDGHEGSRTWEGTVLEGLRSGDSMYFVHSFCVRPRQASVVLSVTEYGPAKFCSSVQRGNIIGFQFHPERSGSGGLRIYRNLRAMITMCLK